jgi:hypothetical protein
MSLIDVTSWTCIAVFTCFSALFLFQLAIGRAKPEMTEPGARRNAWRKLRWSLLPIATGVFMLAGWWKHGWWLVSLFWFAIAAWDFYSPRRARLSRS